MSLQQRYDHPGSQKPWMSQTLDGFPLSRECIHGAYRYFWGHTHSSRQEAEANELASNLTATNTLLGDFCDGRIYPQAFDVAMLSPLASHFTDSTTSRVAMRALQSYTSAPEICPGDTEYTLALIEDRPIIDSFWSDQCTQLFAEDQEITDIIRSEQSSTTIAEHMWNPGLTLKNISTENVMAYFTELGTMCKNGRVNLTSFVVDAADNFAWLLSDKAGYDADTYQRILRSEVLSAPILEALGLEGMASGLRSACNVLRLQNSGNGRFVDDARARLELAGNPEQVEQKVLNALHITVGSTVSETYIGQRGAHGIVMGEALCDTTDNLTRVAWRQKALGNEALKLWQYSQNPDIPDDATPTDEIASTVIFGTREEMAANYWRAYERMVNDEHVVLAPSPSRSGDKRAFYVKGPDGSVDNIEKLFNEHGIQLKDVAVVERKLGFSAAKVTFMLGDIGHETMFMTDDERYGNRIDVAPHALIKLIGKITPDMDISAAIKTLAYIHNNRGLIATNTITPTGRQRGQIFIAAINNTP